MTPYRPRVLRIEPRGAVITGRMADCLDGLLDGLTDDELAARLGITRDTVKVHMQGLRRRVGANNRAHIVGLVLTGRVGVLVDGERAE